MRNGAIFHLLLLLQCLCACQDRNDQIQTYRVAKEDNPVTEMPRESGMARVPGLDDAPAADANELQWTIPRGWQERPASAMRIGSFVINGDRGQQADMSVIPLSGPAGGDLANVNRWRGQLNLPPISLQELSSQSEIIKPAGRHMRMVEFVGPTLPTDNHFKKRLLAAIYTQGERTWFFKMVGEDSLVRQSKPAFLQFLKSLRLRAS